MDVASPKMDNYWNNSPASQCSNYERLNFAASANDDGDCSFSSRRKIARDPMSHRIIEKRRRDRMNNCLADLSRLLPASFLKKGRGRIEKTEIIEMAIKHLKHLQAHACQSETCEIAASLEGRAPPSEQYRLGFHDCISEMMHFLVEVEGFFAEDAFCARLVSHLQKHFDQLSSAGEAYACSEARSSSISSGSNSGLETKANGGSSSEETPAGTSIASSTSNSIYSSASRLENSANHALKQHNGYCDTQSREDHSTSTNSSAKDSHSPDNHSSTQNDSDNCGSQLREMLLSTNPDSCGKKLSVHSDDASGMYKFKTNIHQRFAAEHVYLTPSTSSIEFVEHAEGSFEQETKRRRLEEDLQRSSPFENHEIPIVVARNQHHLAVTAVQHEPLVSSTPGSNAVVPIFALHPQGSFYIPMTLETSLILPLLEHPVEGGLQPMLHPVSISVNFCHPSRTISTKPYQNPTITATNHSDSTIARIDGQGDAWRNEAHHGRFTEKRSSKTRRVSTEDPPDKPNRSSSPTREVNLARQLRASRQNEYQQQACSSRWSYLMAANKRQPS